MSTDPTSTSRAAERCRFDAHGWSLLPCQALGAVLRDGAPPLYRGGLYRVATVSMDGSFTDRVLLRLPLRDPPFVVEYFDAAGVPRG